jgi:transmembrane sensor
MSKILRAPLKRWLDQPLPERDVQRIWRSLHESRRVGATISARLRWIGLGAVGAFALSASLWFIFAARGPVAGVLLVTSDQRALSPGQALGDESQPVQIALSDGSKLDLQPRAALAVLGNSRTHFKTRLQHGRVLFDVKPGGPRRWEIDCGLVRVEVLGTRFTIERDSLGVRVQVDRGVVAVRSAGSDRRLTAGDAIYVASPPLAAAGAEPIAQDAGELKHLQSPDAAQHVAPPPAAGRDRATPASKRSAAAQSLARPLGPTQEAVLVAWLRDADAARRERQTARALALLERVMAAAPASPHAAMAAFTVARSVMADDPNRAVAALHIASNPAAPDWLREDAQARMVEAYARAGQRARAAALARRYTREYPFGRHLAEVERWATAP